LNPSVSFFDILRTPKSHRPERRQKGRNCQAEGAAGRRANHIHEEFDTLDLKEAKALLDELRA